MIRKPLTRMTIIAGKAREHWGILVILIAFMVISYFHATLTPLFVKPDEEWHFAYIVHIHQTGSLPAATERTAYEGYQAPLYYILASLLSFAFLKQPLGWCLGAPGPSPLPLTPSPLPPSGRGEGELGGFCGGRQAARRKIPSSSPLPRVKRWGGG